MRPATITPQNFKIIKNTSLLNIFLLYHKKQTKRPVNLMLFMLK